MSTKPKATKTRPRFKVGDAVLFEFNSGTIKSTRGTEVTSVTDGLFTTSGTLTPYCFKPDELGKVVSDVYRLAKDNLHNSNLYRCVRLNYPDIRRWLVEEWRQAMHIRHDIQKLSAAYTRLDNFIIEIAMVASSVRNRTAYGVTLFQQQ